MLKKHEVWVLKIFEYCTLASYSLIWNWFAIWSFLLLIEEVFPFKYTDINPFKANVSFLYFSPLKTPENLWLSDFFRG